jgi:hypothetical protein
LIFLTQVIKEQAVNIVARGHFGSATMRPNMNVNSVSSAPTRAPQSTSEAAEVKKAGRDNDGDADDGGSAKAAKSAPPPAPTTNVNGQKLGQVVNASA